MKALTDRCLIALSFFFGLKLFVFAASAAPPTITLLEGPFNPFFTGPIQYSYGTAISGDGTVVVGNIMGGGNGFPGDPGLTGCRWTLTECQILPICTGGELTGLGAAYAVSHDGMVTVGKCGTQEYQMFARRWVANSPTPGWGINQRPIFARGVSASGQVAVGYGGFDPVSRWYAYRWPSGAPNTLPQDLGSLGGLNSFAYGVNSHPQDPAIDGTIVVGESQTASGDSHAFRWTPSGGMQDIGTLGGPTSKANAVNRDGSVVVGVSAVGGQSRAFRWTQATGMQDLGMLPNGSDFVAHSTTADGSVVVGTYNQAQVGKRPFIWSQALGMTDLTSFLLIHGANLTGWTIVDAAAISADGTAVTGHASLQGFGGARAFVIRLDKSTRYYVRDSLTTGADNGSSWDNAFRGQDALRKAIAASTIFGSEIWVAKGTYTPAPANGPRTASFTLRNNLAVYGGFAGNETSLSHRDIAQNPTVLSGDLNNDDPANDNSMMQSRSDNSYNILRADSVDRTAVIDGFIIEHASSPSGVNSGALRIVDASPRVANCLFRNNIAASGGAIACVSRSGSSSALTQPLISECAFVSNRAFLTSGGAIDAFVGAPMIRGCTFSENDAFGWGGAISVSDGLDTRPAIVDCVFRANKVIASIDVDGDHSGAGGGGAIACRGQQTLFIQNCVFEGNIAPVGSALSNRAGGASRLFGCLFAGNVASPIGINDDGSTIYTGGTHPLGTIASCDLVNCTIAYNATTACTNCTGGVCTALGTTTRLRNCVLWGNNVSGDLSEMSQIRVSSNGGGAVVVTSCTVQNWTQSLGGEGNNGLNPNFISAPLTPGQDGLWGTADDTGNLRPTPDSLALLDSGDNAGVQNLDSMGHGDPNDIDGDSNTTEDFPWDLDGSPRVQNGTVDRGCYEGFRCAQCPDDRQWFSPQSGDWFDDSRWSFSLPTFCHFAAFDVPGTYVATFATGDQARGIDQTNGDVTLMGEFPSSVLALAPPGIGQSCPGGTPDPQRRTLRVSGTIVDNPSLTIADGTVSAKNGSIGQGALETGSVTVIGPTSKLTLAAGSFDIGEGGQGSLSVLGGASCIAGDFTLGNEDIDVSPADGVADLHATLLVDGAGSVLKPKFNLDLVHGVVTVLSPALIDGGDTGRVLILNNSVLKGDGEVRGEVLNFGEVAPGNSNNPRGTFVPAPLTISGLNGTPTGEYKQLGTDPKSGPQSGTLRLRASGSGNTMQSDSLRVSGTADIAGTLVVEPSGTFQPSADAPAISLLSAGTVTGRFDLAVFPGLEQNRFMRLAYPQPFERGGSVSVFIANLTNNIDLDPPSTANVSGDPADIVAADFDGDNDLDLALAVPDANNPTTAPGQVVILKNAGNTGPNGAWAGFTGGQLTFNVGNNPRGLAVGRFNIGADAGTPNDLVVANFSANTLTVLRNADNGTGTMTAVQTIATGTNPVAVATGEFRDSAGGAIDVAVANQGSNNITILHNTGGTLAFANTLSAGDRPTDIAAARLDAGNSTLDLAVTNGDDDTVTIYYRPPAGGFPTLPSRVLPTGIHPVHVEPGGLDNPKDINDLCVTNFGGGSTSILLNNNLPGGAAGFLPKADLPSGLNPDSLTLGDLDADGDPDLSVVTTVEGERVVRVFRNDQQSLGNGEFQAAFAPFGDQYAGSQPQLVISGDVNNDGREDLIAVNEQTLVFRPGSGGAPERGITAQPGVATSLSIDSNVPEPCPADINGDSAINTTDLTLLLVAFGQTSPPAPAERDINGDGFVNTSDLILLLVGFGQTCP